MEQITLTCPACGREIIVPAELETFSCVYCGAKHRLAELLTPRTPADEADRACVEEHLLDCIRDFPDWNRQFTRKKYEESYRKHLEAVTPTFEAMDRYVCAQPERREALLEAFADSFLEQWDSFHRSHPKARTKHARDRMEFTDKLTLAWYTMPAVRGLGLSISEDFPRVLRDKFNARYPNNRFELGTYEEINAGFRKHGFCFVTTAVCESEGRADDCDELTVFRAFRDGWLAQSAQGRALIEDYYETAPAVVAAMRYGDDEAARCAELRRDWLRPCYEALRRGDNARCAALYIDMMRSLQARYLLS